ncbi:MULTISPECIES: RNA polymerase-binding protein DksA [Helicobacter]|uniref:RNA polymerase-binding protein DksA n=1 Tax=Helicobacter ibis TaxID=2962633 RepID=A0ABT4VBW2_9HELI|nr:MULTISPECIES: RNA polymerase-binding protein DksA [Helicobacter]MDA3966958.1 RNA polymerase-binding protein DksA [Helicobacter sp. WB40]MDA3968184.1 RNA polymerase-binding protein DksA [Helicobacter ibis]
MRKRELDNFKKLLMNNRQMILENNKQHKLDMEYANTQKGDEADCVAMSIAHVLDSSIFEKHKKELELIDRALDKIDDGDYGICEMCDEPISLQRLKAKPHAKYCIVCREIIEKKEKDMQ